MPVPGEKYRLRLSPSLIAKHDYHEPPSANIPQEYFGQIGIYVPAGIARFPRMRFDNGIEWEIYADMLEDVGGPW